MCGAWLNQAMVAAMAASRNDWAAKSRMLVTIQRCATMAICSTSTSAAISVISLFAELRILKRCIHASEEERGDQRQRAQSERHASSSGTRNRRILALVVSTSTIAQPAPAASAARQPRPISTPRPTTSAAGRRARRR